MKTCSECGKKMIQLTAKTPEGMEYQYYKCKCGEEILDMDQLHNVAEKYRKMKRYHAKLSKWGKSLGLRIPKELTKKYNLSSEDEINIVDDETGMRLVPANP